MLLLIYAFYVKCLIPERFIGLANKAIYNSTFKVAKHLREDTKYPGNYTFGNAHFTLLTILSSSQTKDFKGYAVENNYAAIVKRKKFNIPDGFTLLDIKAQEFYSMEKVVASDDKVLIYKVKPLDMFRVFSDIDINTKSPLLHYKGSYNWNEYTDRPNLANFGLFSAGAGAFYSVSAHARIRFRSIKKAEINIDLSLVGKIGAEIQIKRGDHKKYPDIPIFDDIDIPIPGFAISFKFLGLPFEFGLFMTFGAMLKDLEKNLQVDIDYFKGYQLVAKRFICIKRHGKSDSGWQTSFSPIPSNNTVEGIMNSLESNYFTATIQFKEGIKLKAVVFIIYTGVEFGLLQPFQIKFGFSPLACPFPFLYGRLEIPLKAYFDFSGVILQIKLFHKKIRYKLIRPYSKEIYLCNLLKTRKHCLFDYRNNNDYMVSDELDDGDDDDEFINETSNRIISFDVKNLENIKKTKSLISFQMELSEYNSSTQTQLQLFSRRASPFEDITTKNSTFDASIIEAYQNRVTSRISLNFWYHTGTNVIEKSDNFSFFLKEYLRKDEDFIPIAIHNSKKTEEISIQIHMNYCENLTLNEMYVPSLRNGIFDSNFEFGKKLCLIIKDLDQNSTDHIDENATFSTDGTLSESLSQRTVFTYDDEYFRIQFVNIVLPSSPDFGTAVYYEVGAEWGINFERKSLLISNSSNVFQKGANTLLDDQPKVRICKEMRLFIYISYVKDYNIITLKQKITYEEIQQAANSETQKLIKTEPNKDISCTLRIDRYKPIIKVNCSQKNSTHRIITNVYTLDSKKPSEFNPQIIKFEEKQLYGVFEVKKIYSNVKWLIIHMPLIQPLCNYTTVSDEYYRIPFDKDIIYIPFRRENSSSEEIVIEHVVQGNFIDEETLYFTNKYYDVNFDEKPVALAFVRTIHDQYSVTGVDGTKQTLINYGDESFQLLALEFEKDKIILVATSLIIIDEKHPLAEKTIPQFPNWDTVVYHVWCERADEIIMHDQTSGITIDRNIEKDGAFFKIEVTPGHIIDFIPVCNRNLSQQMCYFRQTFSNSSGYAIFHYPEKNGITILNTNLNDLFAQEDRQGLIEEAISTDRSFYYMKTFSEHVNIVRTYQNQLDLELRVINVQNKYKKFCIFDPDGFIVPVSRKYYTNEYMSFMDEFGIESDDEQYIDFSSGNKDSCIYATYASSNYTDINYTEYNDTDINDTDWVDVDDDYTDKSRILLLDNEQQEPTLLNPSTKICDVAKSIKVSYYKDITKLIPPANFSIPIYTTNKVFENDWVNDINILNYEIHEYFLRAKQRIEADQNNSIYVLYLPYSEMKYDINLKENEFISSKENITMHYVDGVLKYILPENIHTIIDLGSKNEIYLNLYGKGTLEFRTAGQTKVIIHGKINLDDIKTIQFDNDVKLVEIENVNVANYTELYMVNQDGENVNIKISNLTILEQAKAKFSNMEISDTLYIKQTATAIVDKTVAVKNAILHIEMIAYQNDLIPMIQGSLIEPPKTIDIQRVSNDGPRHNDEYLIFDGLFDCQSWIDKISYGNSYFNTARCANYNDNYNEAQILNEIKSRAFVSFVKQPPTIKNDRYIDKNLITIIVLSIIDFGLILSIVIVLTCKCYKRKHKSRINDGVDMNATLLTRKSETMNDISDGI